nr:hypothetical protein [uncultured Chryseobacterium sp.]
MTTTNTQEHNTPYISETSPYTSIPAHILLKDNKIKTEFKDYNFKNENFLTLLKSLASLSSCNLHQILRNITKDKIYFIGEKIKIKKTSFKNTPTSISITGESVLESKKRGKSYLKVKDITSEDMLYSFEMDYYMMTPETFKMAYKNYFEPDIITHYHKRPPENRITQTKPENQFTISIHPFTSNQCKGHFENHPVVPFAIAINCIVKEIFDFFGSNSEIENIEGHLSKAIPIETKLEAEFFYQKFLKDQTYIKCEIKDKAGTSYAILMINIKSMK